MDTPNRRLISRRTLVFLVPILLAFLTALVAYLLAGPFKGNAWVTRALSDAATAWAAGAVMVFIFIVVTPFLLTLDVRRLAYIEELIQGTDNRPSTSKIQFLWWTIAVIFAFTVLKVRQLQAAPDLSLSIPPMVLIAMGASAFTAVGAKFIAVGRADKQQGAPNATPPVDDAEGEGAEAAGAPGVAAARNSPTGGDAVSGQDIDKKIPPAGDLRYALTDDGGKADLTKVQLLTWTVVAIALFLWRVGYHVYNDSTPTGDLPDVDPALVVLTGLAQGTYLGRKLVPENTPWLLQLKPNHARPQDVAAGTVEVTISGKNFGAARGGSMLTINAMPVVVDFKDWAPTEIKFLLPPDIVPGDEPVYIGVVVGGQMSANALPFHVREESG